LSLAVPGCYFIGVAFKRQGLLRLRPTRWLLFPCFISDDSEPRAAAERNRLPGAPSMTIGVSDAAR
jgi:hypothetical protein